MTENKLYIFADLQPIKDSLYRAELIKAGTYHSKSYGKFTKTVDDLKEMISHFKDNVLGRKIGGGTKHDDPNEGSISEIEDIYLEGDTLVGNIRLKELDQVNVANEITKRPYISLEIDDTGLHKKEGSALKNLIYRYIHTDMPFIPGLSTTQPIAMSDRLIQSLKLSEVQNDSVARIASMQGPDAENQEMERKRKELKMAEENAEIKKLSEEKSQLETDNAKLLSEKTANELKLSELQKSIDDTNKAKLLSERTARISALKQPPVAKNILTQLVKGEKTLKLSEKASIPEGEIIDQVIALFENLPDNSKLLSELTDGKIPAEETPDEKQLRLSEEGKKDAEARSGKKGN